MKRGAPTLESHLRGRDNNLNAIRMIAASMVLVSHAYPLTLGKAAIEPLQRVTGEPLGHYSVALFFGISGLLIARSFERRLSMVHFAVSRVMRLFPALFFVLSLTVAAGAVFTRLPTIDYIADPRTWSYVPSNLTLAKLQYSLPGVFEDNPFGTEINGSLWTLIFEVGCYVGVVALGLVGGLRKPSLALASMVAIILFHVGSPWLHDRMGSELRPIPHIVLQFADLTYPFMLGTFAYVWRDRLRLSGWAALVLWLPVMFISPGALMESWIVLALIYSAFWVGFVPKGKLLAYNKLGDYSYGVYIYAFPVQQALVHVMPDMTTQANIAWAFPITLLGAVASWMLVERRAIAAAHPLSEALIRRRPPHGEGVRRG